MSWLELLESWVACHLHDGATWSPLGCVWPGPASFTVPVGSLAARMLDALLWGYAVHGHWGFTFTS